MLNDQDLEHAKKIDKYFNLYKADFRSAGLRYLYEETGINSNVIEVIENLPQKITRLFSSMMFLEDYTLTLENLADKEADYVRDMLYTNNFQRKLQLSASSQSYAGYACFEVSQVDGKAMVTVIKPDYVFIEANTINVDLPPKSVKIGWYFQNGEQKYLFLKTHTKETIKAEVWQIDSLGRMTGNALSPANFNIDIPDEEPQFEHGIPVFIVKNDLQDIGDIYGTSDYAGNETLFQELTRNISQISNELHHFGNAMLAVPNGVLDKSGRPKVAGMKMIQIDNEKETFIPQYITNNNPQIDKAQAHALYLLQAVCRSTDIAEILLGINTQGGAEKVGALRLRLLLTLARVKAKLQSYHAVLPSMVSFMAKVEGKEVDASNVYFEFHDGLPKDKLEAIEMQVKRYTGGLQSLEDAIKELDNLDAKELQEKVQKIREEEQSLPAITTSV